MKLVWKSLDSVVTDFGYLAKGQVVEVPESKAAALLDNAACWGKFEEPAQPEPPAPPAEPPHKKPRR